MYFTWLYTVIGSFINNTWCNFYSAISHIHDSYQTQYQITYNKESISAMLRTLSDGFKPRNMYLGIVAVFNETVENIIYVGMAYFALCLIAYSIICRTRRRNVHLPWSKEKTRLLFVTSHPDDECMFFGPLLYTVTHYTDCLVYLLCLSNGNYEKLANQRREELWSACVHLGVLPDNIILINATNLPDDPYVEWKIPLVSDIILQTVEKLDIQGIISFDSVGVSQHPNHCSVYAAIALLCLQNLLPNDCKFYALDSVNVIRKYISIFDIACSFLMSRYWCVLNWKQTAIVRLAMRKHRTQMKWYRWLYIYFSRYMIINSIHEVQSSDVELEMQILFNL